MNHAIITSKDFDSSFLDEVESRSGQNIRSCYVCGKCSAGCPQAPDMKHLPHQIMVMVQDGMRSRVINSPTMWVCAACATCTTRCPKEIDINAVMDTLNEMATSAGSQAGIRVKIFREEFLNSIIKHGRLYELGLALRLNLRKGEPFNDADMGLQMFKKGKIHFKADTAPNKNSWQKLFKRET